MTKRYINKYIEARRGGLRTPLNEDTYDALQVCLNGHVITDQYHDSPSGRKNRCPDCGAETIYTCPRCDAEIKGNLRQSGVACFPLDVAPKYCENCGAPFPWTEKAIRAAKELLQEAELSPEERERAATDVENIVKDTPMAEAGVKRLKRYSKKTGGWLWDEIKSVLVDCASETIKKLLLS